MKKSVLAFIQEDYYKDNFISLRDQFKDHQITVVSRSPISFKDQKIKNFYPKTVFILLLLIFRLRKRTFSILLASNVDDFFFHLIYKFVQFEELITFDEGQRSLYKEDKYFKKSFIKKGQRRYSLMNTLFGFPLPYGEYYERSSTHFTFFDPEVFDHALKDHKNLILINKKLSSVRIKKVFVGVSSNWFFDVNGKKIDQKSKEYREKIKLAALRINKISPDLYLMHPREGREIIDLLDKSIIVSKNPDGGNERLINALNNSQSLTLFTERSGLVFDIDLSIEVVFLDVFDRFEEEEFQQFIDSFNRLRNSQGSDKSECIKYIFKE